MNIHSINDFDKAVAKTVKEIETKHDCWIWILSDDNYWYINVCYITSQQLETEVKMCPLNSNGYELATAIRKYFR